METEPPLIKIKRLVDEHRKEFNRTFLEKTNKQGLQLGRNKRI